VLTWWLTSVALLVQDLLSQGVWPPWHAQGRRSEGEQECPATQEVSHRQAGFRGSCYTIKAGCWIDIKRHHKRTSLMQAATQIMKSMHFKGDRRGFLHAGQRFQIWQQSFSIQFQIKVVIASREESAVRSGEVCCREQAEQDWPAKRLRGGQLVQPIWVRTSNLFGIGMSLEE